MGYVHDTHMSRFISPAGFMFSAGVWTPGEAANVVSITRAAADAAFVALVPLPLLSNEAALKGSRLKSVDVYYAIGVAAADDFATVELEKMYLGMDDTAISGTAIPISLDAGHDTAAERKAVDTDHVMTVTLNEPAWMDDAAAYALKMAVDCAATTVFTFFGARVNFDFRV